MFVIVVVVAAAVVVVVSSKVQFCMTAFELERMLRSSVTKCVM